jgi:phosphatidylglycerophosphate synthase
LDQIPAGSKRHRGVFADLHALVTRWRKNLADVLVPSIPLQADDVTRIRGWVCFLVAIALLYRNLPFAIWLLFFALVLDSADGAVARRQGVDCPQTDRAMDIFTEFMLYAAYLKSYPGWISAALMGLWVVPKTVWIARYLGRRFAPGFKAPRSALWRNGLSVFTALQSFLFAHTLLVLIFLQWAFRWDLP